jgi:hypothetical protein
MCGINGVFSFDSSAPPVDRDSLIRTRDLMAARGPDGAGEWSSSDGRGAFGHRRLAIIDPTPDGGTFLLGFEKTETKFFELNTGRRKELLFTIVGERTAGFSKANWIHAFSDFGNELVPGKRMRHP